MREWHLQYKQQLFYLLPMTKPAFGLSCPSVINLELQHQAKHRTPGPAPQGLQPSSYISRDSSALTDALTSIQASQTPHNYSSPSPVSGCNVPTLAIETHDAERKGKKNKNRYDQKLWQKLQNEKEEENTANNTSHVQCGRETPQMPMQNKQVKTQHPDSEPTRDSTGYLLSRSIARPGTSLL
jgi:hypothetical protein